MNGRFQYFTEISKLGELMIDNIGDCCLSCGDDLGNVFYLAIKTADIGIVHCLEFGPLTMDGDFVPTISYCKYESFQYNESAIKKKIGSFLNRRDYLITYADCIDIETIKEKMIDIPTYFHQKVGF